MTGREVDHGAGPRKGVKAGCEANVLTIEKSPGTHNSVENSSTQLLSLCGELLADAFGKERARAAQRLVASVHEHG